MLSKQNRLPRKLFTKAFKKSRSFFTQNLTLRVNNDTWVSGSQVLGNRTPKYVISRFSVVTPSSVSKKAVVRNLLKRRCYSIIKKHLNNIKISFNIMIFLKKGADKLKFSDLEKEVISVFRKASLL